MAGFRLTKPYTMPKEEIRAAAEGLADSLGREHGVRSRWEGAIGIIDIDVRGHSASRSAALPGRAYHLIQR